MQLGIVFPGQGSQSVGMLTDIARDYPEVAQTFAESSAVLNYDLWRLVEAGPASELDKTVHTQPALLTAAYAIWRILKKNAQHIKPILLAGHSLGEYTALVCAEALAFQDAVRLVAARGQYMQEAVPEGQGALAAIVGLDDDNVKIICEKAALNDTLSPANFNCPGQVVIAGHVAAVSRALILAKEAGAKLAKQLPVSVPSHSALMKPAAQRLQQLLATISFQKPVIPVLNNVDVAVYDTAESIRDGLVRQLYMPVQWVKTIQTFANKNIQHIIECGPGKVLSGLNKRIAADITLTQTTDLTSLQNVLNTSLCS